MRKIYWYCVGVSESDRAFVADVLNGLASNLQGPPVEIEVLIEEVSNVLGTNILAKLPGAEDFGDFSACIAKDLRDENPSEQSGFVPGLLVYCSKDDHLAKSARASNPSAEWGATCGRLAVIWIKNNEKLIWHEALHLLGAVDCYDKDTLVDRCEKEPGCIMGYAPTNKSVTEWPDCLCLGTADRLRSPDSVQQANGQVRRNYIWKVKDSPFGLYRYTRYDSTAYGCSEKKDYPLGKPIYNIRAWHSKLVSRETSFETTAAESASFGSSGKDSDDRASWSHQDLVSTDGTRKVGSTKYQFDDGSYITEWYERSRR